MTINHSLSKIKMKFQFQLFFTFILSLFSVVVAEELIIGDCLDIKEYLEKKDLEYHQIIRNCLIDSNQKVSTLYVSLLPCIIHKTKIYIYMNDLLSQIS